MHTRPFRTIAGLAVIASVGLAAAPATASTPEPVSIHVVRDAAGDRWTAEGAITGSGTFIDDPGFSAGKSSTYHVVRTFTDADGTFTARGDVRIVSTGDPAVFDVVGRWAIVSTTGADAGLHGAGSIREVFDTAAGVITGEWSGSLVT